MLDIRYIQQQNRINQTRQSRRYTRQEMIQIYIYGVSNGQTNTRGG